MQELELERVPCIPLEPLLRLGLLPTRQHLHQTALIEGKRLQVPLQLAVCARVTSDLPSRKGGVWALPSSAAFMSEKKWLALAAPLRDRGPS